MRQTGCLRACERECAQLSFQVVDCQVPAAAKPFGKAPVPEAASAQNVASPTCFLQPRSSLHMVEEVHCTWLTLNRHCQLALPQRWLPRQRQRRHRNPSSQATSRRKQICLTSTLCQTCDGRVRVCVPLKSQLQLFCASLPCIADSFAGAPAGDPAEGIRSTEDWRAASAHRSVAEACSGEASSQGATGGKGKAGVGQG